MHMNHDPIRKIFSASLAATCGCLLLLGAVAPGITAGAPVVATQMVI